MDISKGFSSRLAALQRLCSDDEPSEKPGRKRPSALLFVPGLDGRNNKGSLVVLKYLFEGSCGRDLLEGNLPDFLEVLEEMVLLVQATRISFLYTRDMKKALLPWLDNLGGSLLVEYLSSAEQESNVDLLQDWKCVNFKRMMMEAVPAGRGVGIPLPLGYDGITDVEGWPLLQTFALDSVYHPTGFITNRYCLQDVTEYLDVLYRTIDAPCVHLAVETMRTSSLPHALQSIDLLDSSAEQRARRTAEDILGPLDMLYEFGELHCAEPADPNMRPVLLLGADTQHFSLPRAQLPRGWTTRPIGSAQHMVVEGGEPSTGMRWCRTYLLQCGRCLDFLRDYDALVDDSAAEGEGEGDDDAEDDEAADEIEQATVFGMAKITAPRPAKVAMRIVPSLARAIVRLEALYAKLWLSLRWAVRIAYETFSDVLEAGTFLQAAMDELMRGLPATSSPSSSSAASSSGSSAGAQASDDEVTVVLPSGEKRALRYPPGLGLGALVLTGGERLQVHVDCINSLGQVVTIDDIDDMGGSCWTYVRVAVHGVLLEGRTKSHDESRGCVAVGDTFLFSVGAQGRRASPASPASPTALLLGDSICLTHAIPYYRCLVGPGAEDASARRLQASARSAHMLSALGLGKLVESSAGGYERSHLAVPVLTDHPLLPHCLAAVRVFTAGLVVDKLDVPCLPIMLSIGAHVERVWSMDFAELCTQAAARCARGSSSAASDSALAVIQQFRGTEGVLIVFKTKSFTSASLEKESAARRRAAQEDAAVQQKALAARQVRRAAGILVDDDEDGNDDEADLAESENSAGGSNIVASGAGDESSSTKPRAGLDASANDLSPMERALQFNPLQRCLPSLPGSEDGPRHLALLILSSSRGQKALSAAIATWRAALRLHDLSEHRGASAVPLPDPILDAFLAFLDARSYQPEYAESFVLPGAMGEPGVCVEAAECLELDSVGGRGAQGSAGLLGLQVSFALAEARRGARLRAAALGPAESVAEQVQETEEKDDDAAHVAGASPAQLVVVTGHPGSGISLVGPHLANRLGRALASGDHGKFRNDMPLCDCLHLDLTMHAGGGGSGSAGGALVAAWRAEQASRAAPRSQVMVVTLVQPPSQHGALAEVLPLLCSLAGGGAVVSAVVAVVCPGGLDGPRGSQGIGEELWRATCLEPLHAGQACDLVLCTDLDKEPSAQFSQLRAWVGRANPQAVCVRASGVRVEEGPLEVILAKLAPLPAQEGVPAGVTVCLRRLPCAVSCFAPPLGAGQRPVPQGACRSSLSQLAEGPAAVSLRCLCSLLVPPPSDAISPWSIPSLLLLLQHLFPLAPVSSTITDTWRIPDNTSGQTGLRRAITLSSTKVMAGRQKRHERQVFEAALRTAGLGRPGKAATTAGAGHREDDQGSALTGLVRSVHGIVLVVRQDKTSGAAMGHSLATIEACGGCILIRHADDAAAAQPSSSSSAATPVGNPTCNTLSLSGILRSDDSAALLALFALCRHAPLPRKAPVTRADVTHAELLALQHDDPAIATLPLPAGWYSDGQNYWGPHGVSNCSRELRPDIEALCEAHLVKRNRQVAEYNKLLDDLQGLI